VRAVIVVPCFNEEQRLDRKAFLDFTSEDRVEFCFVDDGSRDGTFRVLNELQQQDSDRISVMQLEQNSGKAEAVRRGLLAAAERKPDFIGFWDADLATPLSEIPSFLDVMKERPEVTMVLGARVRLLGRSISRNPSRHYFGRFGATLISNSLGLAVYDTQCGAKLFRVTDEIVEIFRQPFLSRWIFDVEILARYVRRCGRDVAAKTIYELPIQVWRDVRGSKLKSTDFARALRDLWKIHRTYNKR
jgi:glycosyltransferase involved in cell wall biosynthesis